MIDEEINKLSKENHDIKDELLASHHKDEIKEKTVEEMNQEEKKQFLNDYFKNLGVESLKQIGTFFNNYMYTSKVLMSAFPEVPDETTRDMQKIRKIIFKHSEATPLNYIPVLPWNDNNNKEISYYPLFTIEEATQIIDDYKDVEPIWRDPAYSLPELKGFACLVSYKRWELSEIVQNPAEHADFLAQKMRAFNNTLAIGMNGLQKNVLKHLIKLVLNIYKKAQLFNKETEYKRPNYDTENNRILTRANYSIDHVYLRNQDGTKVGVVYKNIPANTYNTYEEAETAGAIVTLNLIKKVSRPKAGNTKLEEQESVDKFIKTMKQLEFDFSRDLSGYCLNGSDIGRYQKDLRVFLIDNIFPYLATNNIGQLRIVDDAITVHSFFDDKEINDDNNAENDTKLGLSHVYGLIGDFSSEQPLASIQIIEEETYTKAISYSNKTYFKSVVLPRFVISPNQFITLIVDENFKITKN